MKRFIAGLVVSLVAANAWACINTTYSRKHETQITADLAYLIIGQFPHHGKAFYDDQVKRTQAKLTANLDDVEARNDLAAAYVKLGLWAAAKGEFDRIEKEHPGRYRTHANLGVMYKKMGQFDDAARHIAQSLAIKPEGHLGLGDYYLRMLRWKSGQLGTVPMEESASERVLNATTESAQPAVMNQATNFLGIDYNVSPEVVASSELVNKKYLETLIIADRTFPDVYLVLGDVLAAEGEDQLALRAYYRAEELGHPRSDVVSDRMELLYAQWRKQLAGKSGYMLEPLYRTRNDMYQEREAAKTWVDNFEKTEAELVAAGKEVDYTMVKDKMAALGMASVTINELGLVPGTVSGDGLGGAQGQRVFVLGVIVLGVFTIIVVAITASVIYARAKKKAATAIAG